MKRWLFFAGMVGAALLVGAIISLFFRDWLRQEIVLPLAYLAWILRLLVLSVPQVIFWVLLVIFGLILALSTLWPEEPPRRIVDKRIANLSYSRYATWHRYAEMLNRSNFAIDSFGRDLVRLTVQILASQQDMSPEEVYSQLDRGAIELPADLKAFLHRRGFVSTIKPEPRLIEWFHRFFPAREAVRPPGVYTSLEEEVLHILSQIESLLSRNEEIIDEPVSVEVNQ